MEHAKMFQGAAWQARVSESFLAAADQLAGHRLPQVPGTDPVPASAASGGGRSEEPGTPPPGATAPASPAHGVQSGESKRPL